MFKKLKQKIEQQGLNDSQNNLSRIDSDNSLVNQDSTSADHSDLNDESERFKSESTVSEASSVNELVHILDTPNEELNSESKLINNDDSKDLIIYNLENEIHRLQQSINDLTEKKNEKYEAKVTQLNDENNELKQLIEKKTEEVRNLIL